MNKINVNHIDFKYSKKQILDINDILIQEGKITAIVGPNGSGKTTLIRVIAKLLKANNSSIFINDKELKDIKVLELSKMMAVLNQKDAIKEFLTVNELVEMARSPYKKRFMPLSNEDMRIIDKSLEITGVKELKNRYINTLSGGEEKRVHLARLLAQDTDILILDEPINHLDIEHQKSIMELIKDLSIKEKKTIIIILHDLNFSYNYADYIIMLKDGNIYSKGIPEEVITKKSIKEVYNIDIEIIDHPKMKKAILF